MSRTIFAPCSRSTSPTGDAREATLDSLLEEFDIARLRKAPSIALSGGERRRCEIARALAGKPSFMLLDEPFAGIDPIAVGDIQDLVRHLKSRGIGVLITDHNVRETLGLIDRAYIIHSGQVLTEGPPEEIIAHPDVAPALSRRRLPHVGSREASPGAPRYSSSPNRLATSVGERFERLARLRAASGDRDRRAESGAERQECP